MSFDFWMNIVDLWTQRLSSVVVTGFTGVVFFSLAILNTVDAGVQVLDVELWRISEFTLVLEQFDMYCLYCSYMQQDDIKIAS